MGPFRQIKLRSVCLRRTWSAYSLFLCASFYIAPIIILVEDSSGLVALLTFRGAIYFAACYRLINLGHNYVLAFEAGVRHASYIDCSSVRIPTTSIRDSPVVM